MKQSQNNLIIRVGKIMYLGVQLIIQGKKSSYFHSLKISECFLNIQGKIYLFTNSGIWPTKSHKNLKESTAPCAAAGN